jgi:ABC-2 type transport system permease protein
MKLHRVTGLYRRHLHVVTRSFPRVLDATMWPFVDLLMWGLVTLYLRHQQVHLSTPVGFLLGGLLLWDIVFRTKNQVALTFLEETWSRNIIAILASPLTATEYLAASVMWGLTIVGIGWALIAVFAWVLFSFGIATLGPALVLFAVALIVFGVALALVVLGTLLRFGHEADIMAWALAFMVLPFSAVYYPVAVLPGWGAGGGGGTPHLARLRGDANHPRRRRDTLASALGGLRVGRAVPRGRIRLRALDVRDAPSPGLRDAVRVATGRERTWRVRCRRPCSGASRARRPSSWS